MIIRLRRAVRAAAVASRQDKIRDCARGALNAMVVCGVDEKRMGEEKEQYERQHRRRHVSFGSVSALQSQPGNSQVCKPLPLV